MQIKSKLYRSRLRTAFFLFCLLMLVLCIRIGYIQFVKGDEYKAKAIIQQKKDEVIKPERGKIVDRNGVELAVNIQAYSVWITPNEINAKGDKEKEEKVRAVTEKVAEILGEDKEAMVAKVASSKSISTKVAKGIERSVAEKIWNEELYGVYLREDTQRSYPMGSMMSKVLGGVNDDNSGILGIESYYNKELSGINGKWVKETDVSGNSLASGTEKYYEPKDGADVVLTIDQTLQMQAEESIKKTYEETKAKKVSCIAMDPKTGEILVMATYPSFDSNDPRKPYEQDKEAYAKMDAKQQLDYLNEMWRNPLVSDNYEPGSTMKLITTASALEEGVVTTEDTFFCPGYKDIAGYKVKCYIYPKSHGTETLYQIVSNSCNVAFMELGKRLGTEKYYNYLELFGFTESTGIDFPGESRPIIIPEKQVKEIDLEIMAFGQTSSVNPIHMITAVSAIGNDGKLMKPHLVKSIDYPNGDKKKIENTVVRQAISKETADEVLKIMENNVETEYRKAAYKEGYRIGGKTGTAQIAIDGGYDPNRTITSFISLAPVDDPQIALLYIVDSSLIENSTATAAKPGGELIKKMMDYLEIKPRLKDGQKVQNDEEAKAAVPSVVGMKASKAKEVLKNAGFNYKITPKQDGEEDFVVKEQYPASGESAGKNTVVYIYRE